MIPLRYLDDLARSWSIIFGKAIDFASLAEIDWRAAPRVINGRTDAVDAASPGTRRGLAAWGRLCELAKTPEGKRHAGVLLVAEAMCGAVMRASPARYIYLARLARGESIRDEAAAEVDADGLRAAARASGRRAGAKARSARASAVLRREIIERNRRDVLTGRALYKAAVTAWEAARAEHVDSNLAI
jgi:hypothetical protein